MPRLSLLSLFLLLPACSQQQVSRPTPAQCEDTYQLALVACDAGLPDPKSNTQCHAAAVAVRLACLIVSAPPTPPSATESTPLSTPASRWSEALPLLQSGRMTPDEFSAYVLPRPH